MQKRFVRWAVAGVVLALMSFGEVLAQSTKGGSLTPVPDGDSLQEAIRHYQRGEFDAAIQNFNAVLQQNPHSSDAYAGLVRVFLKQKNVDLAADETAKGLRDANSPSMHVVAGEVYFRRGMFGQAEKEWVNVINNGHEIARAYYGLSRIRNSVSLYAQAKRLLDKAHELDPTDPEIQKDWIDSQSKSEQIKFWETYLASPTNDDADAHLDDQQHLEYLKATEHDAEPPCELAGSVTSVAIPMARMLADPDHISGYGLEMAVNGKKGKLLLDTGAGGITIDQVLARKAGIEKISNSEVSGIGDKGRSSGYLGIAKQITVGGLEFHNCMVTVIAKRSVAGDEGLVGADLFHHFLVELDFPKEMLRLSPLPPRPGDDSNGVNVASTPSGKPANPPSSSAKSAAASDPAPSQKDEPLDRYIAPEMKSYMQVFRFDQMLLVPTRVGEAHSTLFAIDSGANTSLISVRSAKSTTKVHFDDRSRAEGVDGKVAKVFRADKVRLQFGHMQQDVNDLPAFDLSHLSEDVGTEVSGLLGMNTLFMLEVRIDYRDGIVDFTYAPPP
jgi:hypothetical protein